MYRILGIGELLWDMLPAGAQLGGAPANYGVMAARLGNDAAVISRIGHDRLGEKALEVLRPFPIDLGLLQVDQDLPTGQVTVELLEGQPSYIIQEPVAWDALEMTDAWEREAARADAVCFGSLAQRSERSRQTIHAIVRATQPECQRIFDVNLRMPLPAASTVRDSLELASVMKMNDVEVPQVLTLLGLKHGANSAALSGSADLLRSGAERLLIEFPQLQLVAITCGGEGSLLVGRSAWDRHPGLPIKVADTIGAGDAFTAAMTHYLLRGASLKTLNEAGNRWGSYIASQSGAMPLIPAETLERISREIEG